MNFAEWAGTADKPGSVVDLRLPGALDWLVGRYAAARPAVLRTVLSHIFGLGAQSLVIEHRYLDLDYRNEHSRFYSGTFRRYPSITHRFHFFASPPPPDLEDAAKPARFHAEDYLGYSIMRPVPGAPVGRTLVSPGEGFEEFVSCRAEDRVNLYGLPLSPIGAPFIAQDAQLTVCAHASVWMAAYYYHRRFGTPRVLPGDIADAVPSAIGFGRPTPSSGLSVFQLTEAARLVGLPCLAYNLASPPLGEDLFSLSCRYLNSEIPVIIGGGGHAFTLVGYQQYLGPDGSKRIRFIRQDDEVGPYRLVDNPQLDEYSPWQYVIVPLPNKIYVSGEAAEAVGREMLRRTLASLDRPQDRRLIADLDSHAVRIRTRVMLSNDFKEGLLARGLDETTAEIYQRIPMPRWIWVVEATVAAERDKGAPCVVAEAVIDATDHLRDLHVLTWRVPGQLYRWAPDEDDYLIYSDLPEDRVLICASAVSQRVAA